MPLQPFVREAVEAIQRDAEELLNGQYALKDDRHRRLMISIRGCAIMLRGNYDGFMKHLSSLESWLDDDYLKELIPLSPGSLGSIRMSCEVVRRIASKPPLDADQLALIEAIEQNQKRIVVELDRYRYDELGHHRY